MDSIDTEPIMVIRNPDGLIVLAGKPRKLTAKEQKEYLAPGWKVETMDFKKYKELNLKWVWDEK